MIHGADSALMLMPDTIVEPVTALAETYAAVEEGATAAVTLHRVAHPMQFGVARLSPQGAVLGFVDKPACPPSDWIWSACALRLDFSNSFDKLSG